MDNAETPRPVTAFKRSSDADTNPIPVAQIQAKLAEEAVLAEGATQAKGTEHAGADEVPPPAERPSPSTAGTRVIDVPPVPTAAAVAPDAPAQPPVRPAPIPGRPAAAEATAPVPGPPPPARAAPPPAPRPVPPALPTPPQLDPRLNQPAPQPVSTPFTTAAPSAPPQHQGVHDPRMPSHTDLGLVRRVRPLPQSGWRKVVHRVTGLNPKESEQENTRQKLIARVSQPVRGDYSIAVLSMKGGVGKTTTTVGLGSTFAAIRGDRVIAVDANPDFGTLAQRGPDQSRSTVRDLLLDDNIFRYSDIRRHTSQSTSRLEILASERDPATSEAFSDADYRVVIRLLQRFYNLILTDCGTGLVHSAMESVLDEADAIVLVASPAIDAARSALATLDWLEHHGRGHLVPNATVVISAARPGKSSVDLDKLAAQFLTRIRAVHVIPFDDHLAQGSEIVLDLMASKTRQAFLELAASIADGFAHTKRAERNSRS
ncbi:MinD/ParA family ATP-binding protein [Mycobacterium asiaticum]|uniref:MinD/ParA family ATP-binding protein n=1 Tax=Mycobacterium asiaticum TaxID=1790 RepID=UPI0006891492